MSIRKLAASLLICLPLVILPTTVIAQDLSSADLHEAAQNGEIEIVKKALDSGIDVNAPTQYGSTALSYAADRGHTDIVALLLENGADPNVKDTFYNATPITWAQMKGHKKIVGLLYAGGAEGADAALKAAVGSNEKELVKLLLESGRVTGKAIEAAKKKAEDKEDNDMLAVFESAKIVEAEEFTLTEEQLASYIGTYAGDGRTGIVTASKTKLKIKTSTGTFFLTPVSENKFKAGQAEYRFEFVDGKIASLSIAEFRNTSVLKPVSAEEAEKIAKAQAETKKNDSEDVEKEKIVFAPSSAESKAADLAISSSNWPGFKGNGARGIADGQLPPRAWDAETGDNLIWKTKVPGLGNSCPTIWGDKLFVTSAVNPEADNDFRIGLYGDVESVEEDFEFEFNLYCLDKNTGEILWQKQAHKAKPAVKRHAKSTHANPTVATDGKHVIAFFASEGLYCYDMDGNLKWQRDFGLLDSGWFYDAGYQWGFGASPIIFEEMVIVQCDIQKDSFVAALDINTGNDIWKTPREGEIPSWSTPTVHRFDDVDMLITHATRAARGYDVRTGKELWQMRDHSEIVVPTPFVAHGLIYIASGYSPIQPIIAIRPSARGDITLVDDTLTSENIAWSTKRGGPYMPSPICYGDYLYCCGNSGILTCYSAETGEEVYKKRLKAPGGTISFTGSPVAADGHLYFTTEDGRTLVVKAGPEFELVGTNKLGENVLTTPAISQGKFYIRGQQHVYAFGDSPK